MGNMLRRRRMHEKQAITPPTNHHIMFSALCGSFGPLFHCRGRFWSVLTLPTMSSLCWHNQYKPHLWHAKDVKVLSCNPITHITSYSPRLQPAVLCMLSTNLMGRLNSHLGYKQEFPAIIYSGVMGSFKSTNKTGGIKRLYSKERRSRHVPKSHKLA